MLLGQSVFQSVVERLKALENDRKQEPDGENAGDTRGKEAVSFRPKGLGSGFVFDTALTPEPAALARTGDAYFHFPAERRAPAEPPERDPEPEPMPAHLQRTSLAEVAEELALGRQETLETLGEKRRAFARLNHPDRVSPALRPNATLRMSAANLLIDRAIGLLPR